MDKLQPLINESVQLMLIGMGTVFIILIMLIFLINVVSKLVISLKLEDEPATTARAAYTVNKKIAATDDNELIAVISSAISTYKKQNSTS